MVPNSVYYNYVFLVVCIGLLEILNQVLPSAVTVLFCFGFFVGLLVCFHSSDGLTKQKKKSF